jgi:hypothetical protein
VQPLQSRGSVDLLHAARERADGLSSSSQFRYPVRNCGEDRRRALPRVHAKARACPDERELNAALQDIVARAMAASQQQASGDEEGAHERQHPS